MTFIDGGASAPLILTPMVFKSWAFLGAWATAAVSPVTGDRTPMLNPDLNVLVSSTAPPSSVEWQVSTSSSFSSILFTATDTGVSNGALLKIVTTTLTDLSTYYWRARAGDGAGVWGAWTVTQKFTVDLNQGRGYGQVYFNNGNNRVLDVEDYASGFSYINNSVVWQPPLGDVVFMYENIWAQDNSGGRWAEQMYWGDASDNTPTPHIWWLKPNHGRSGDGIQIICFGVGDLQTTFDGTVEIYKGLVAGWEPVPINSWQAYPATVNAYNNLRTIDEMTEVVDMQHQIVEVTVPAGAVPPGYSLRLKTTGP